MDGGFQLAHTGSGGMTSSLSVGTAGSAAVRRLKQFPLSPVLVTGRSSIKIEKTTDPRGFTSTMSENQMAAELQYMAACQWPSRTKPVLDRQIVEEMLKDGHDPSKPA